MAHHATHHPSMPRFHRWIHRWFDFDVNLAGLIILDRDIELDLAAGRD
jgi:hypothetical protein